MKISKRGEYALRSLIALGVAEATTGELTRLADIARNEVIPEQFLQLIFIELKAAGLVSAVRGKNGGYRLGKPADSIMIGDVVRLIDGPLAPIRCVSKTAYERCSCPDETKCGLRRMMGDVREAISDILDRHTLADLVALSACDTPRRTSLPSAGFSHGDGI